MEKLRTKGFVCELCQIACCSEESYLEHLKEEHSKKEVEMLLKLAKLDIEDPERYEELCWELIRLEHYELLKSRKEKENEESKD